jgi:hypothetical protein
MITRSELHSEWIHIVKLNALDIIDFDELRDLPAFVDRFYSNILSTFEHLARLKHQKVYNAKELQTVYLLVKDVLYDINDLLIQLNDKGLPALIYEVVFNIFEELLLLSEDYELYETAQNLLNFRTLWFSNFGIKIMKVTREQK